MGQEKRRRKATKIVGIIVLMIAVGGFVFVRYLPSRQQTATISTPILDESFTCYPMSRQILTRAHKVGRPSHTVSY